MLTQLYKKTKESQNEKQKPGEKWGCWGLRGGSSRGNFDEYILYQFMTLPKNTK